CMTGHGCKIGVVAWPALLLAGCLFHRPPGSEDAAPEGPGSAEERMVAQGKGPESNYRLLPPVPPSAPHRLRRDQKPPPPPPPPAAPRPLDPALATPPTPPPAPAARPDSPLLAALRCAVEDNPEEAAKLLREYDEPSRALLLALLRLTAGVGAGDLD